MQAISFCAIDFSALTRLKVVYADGNPCLYSIPASLAGIESLGVQGCNVSFSHHATMGEDGEEEEEENRGGCCVLKIRAPREPVPPLMELAAKMLHENLRGVVLQPLTMCDEFCVLLIPGMSPQLPWSFHSVFPYIPTSLLPWLVPRGRCVSPSCTRPVFFSHHYSYLVPGLTFQRLTILSEAGYSDRLPSDLSVCLDFCSQHCAHTVLSLLKT